MRSLSRPPTSLRSGDLHPACARAMAVPLGLLNALMNLVVWTVHALVTRLSESVYARASAWEVSARGRTTCTDAAEIAPAALLLGGAGPVLRRGRAWWVCALLLSLALLVPLELLVESGIESNARCRPRTIRASKGVCASKWKGHSLAGVAAAALLVQRFKWADPDWAVVLEGSAKSPRSAEVRTAAALKDGRRVLAAGCRVDVTPCVDCGSFKVQKIQSAFDTVVLNASFAPRGADGIGDVTYDQAMMLAFFFWPGATVPEPARDAAGRRRIFAHGIEALMSKAQISHVLKGTREAWKLPVLAVRDGKPNARVYNISCQTDGVTSSNFARAISLYRTIQMEQPGVRRVEVRGDIRKLPVLTASDAAKAVFAMKAEDWSKDCVGDVDAYSECGTFAPLFVVPFFALAAVLVVAWAVVRVVLRRVRAAVPHDAQSWRRKAHELATSMRNAREGAGGNGARACPVGTEGIWAESRDRGAESVYDPSVFVVHPGHAAPTPPARSYRPNEDSFLEIGAVNTPSSYVLEPRFDADR